MATKEGWNMEPGAPSSDESRRQLASELAELEQRMRAETPEYEPPAYSEEHIESLVDEMVDQVPEEAQPGIRSRLRGALSREMFDPEIWKGAWYMLNYTAKYYADMVKRRYTGEYDTDEWGLDWEFLGVARPFLTFLYKVYWRVETTGLENVPIEGRALLVSNHSGMLPWDGVMVGTALLTEHPAQRLVRTLYAGLLNQLPYVSTALVRLGQTLATVENGTRLLEQDELVAVFPEGYKGVGKSFKDRYRLARFGRGGFVEMALNTHAPIIPVAVVGCEETYINVAKLPTFTSEEAGLPYLPITLTFPWLGLLGFVPLPTKWYIDFGQPIPMERYDSEAALNPVLLSQLTDQVRNTIQEMLYSRLEQRRSIFFG